jgi:hypothetical protein
MIGVRRRLAGMIGNIMSGQLRVKNPPPETGFLRQILPLSRNLDSETRFLSTPETGFLRQILSLSRNLDSETRFLIFRCRRVRSPRERTLLLEQIIAVFSWMKYMPETRFL